MAYDMRYDIGQRMHFSVYSNFNFALDAEIIGISNYGLAEEYSNVLLLLFNNDATDTTYTNLIASNSYYYICKVIKNYNTADLSLAVDDIIVLCDSLILTNGTYVLDESKSMYLTVSYNAFTSGYTNINTLITDIQTYLTGLHVTSTITLSMTEEEKNTQDLADALTLLNKVKELDTCVSTVNNLKGINATTIVNTYSQMITLLQNQIDRLIQNS